MTARQAALRALNRWRRAGEFSEAALDGVISEAGLDGRDAALCTRICFGVIQNLTLLDFYIRRFSTMPPEKLEPKVLDILRLSAYQLVFMDRIPPSAAVSEGVGLCNDGYRRASGLVNAVLRRISENRGNLPEPEGEGSADYLAVKYSHPLWLAEELINAHGYDFAEAFFAANNREPPLCAQTNTLKISAEKLAARLEERDITVTPGGLPGSLRLAGAGRLATLPEFRDGLFYVQDEAARSAVAVAGVKPGMNVLDACAAPGGKSFAAAILMENTGRVVSCDLGEKKLPLILSGALRLDIDIIEARVMDARHPDPDLTDWADVVIADAPCSGLGVIRKKPEIRWKKPEDIAGLPEIQYAILDGLAPCVKPGGVLLYSTCTVLERENEYVARRFLSEHPEFHLDGEMTTLWPQVQETDGFFICRMVKSI